MILLDLFSGIGGFHLGLEKAGFHFEKVYFSELDKHAIANYRYNFKSSTYVGSVESIPAKRIERPGIITFGSPCQDFSINGKGAGLRGGKSCLLEKAIQLIGCFKPDFFIWENVKGVFFTNGGRDFFEIIKAFTDIGCYRLEWQLLDSSWFRPQKRERVFLIGHLAKKSKPFVFPLGRKGKETSSKRANTTYTLTSSYPNSRGAHVVERSGLVRQMTEIECERLQGFPDDYTRYGIYEEGIKEISKTNRYKMVGNAVTVDIVSEIGKKLNEKADIHIG